MPESALVQSQPEQKSTANESAPQGQPVTIQITPERVAYIQAQNQKAAGPLPAASGGLNTAPKTPSASPSDQAYGPLEGGNKYAVGGEKKSEPGEYSNWKAVGKGYGNRESDTPQPVDAKDPNGPKEVANATQGAPSVAEANFDGIPTKTSNEGNGAYVETSKGTVTESKFDPSGKYDGKSGSADLYSGRAAAGAQAKAGLRAKGEIEGKAGKLSGSADVHAVANAGADATLSVGTGGVYAGANASAKVGVGASVDGDYSTPELAIAGVDKPLNAGAGVHADGFAGAKAGAGVKVGLGPELVGAEGKIGAFAGAEGKADIHGNLGPLGGKLGVSGLAGAGIGAEGAIVYENGKIRIGGKLYACFGLGGAVEGEITIDIKQAIQLGIVTVQEAYKLADGDHDGKLTLNDPATHAANVMQGGAKAIDSGVGKVLNTLDANNDGKINAGDVKAVAGEIGNQVVKARDKVVDLGQQALEKGKQTLDRDGDGKLGVGDIKAGAGQLKDAAVDKLHKVEDLAVKGLNKAHDALDHDGDGKLELADIGAHIGDAGHAVIDTGKQIGTDVVNKLDQMKDFAVDKGKQVANAVHNAADVNNDGKVDAADAKALVAKAQAKVEEMGHDLKQSAQQAMQSVHDGLDVNHDGKVDAKDAVAAAEKVKQKAIAAKDKAVQTFQKTVQAGQQAYEKAKAKVQEVGKKIYDAADLNHDGKVDGKDAAVAADKAKDWAKEKASQAGKAVHDAADRNHDGKVDAKDISAGASQAKTAIVNTAVAVKNEVKEKATQLYDAAAGQVKQATETLKSGYNGAKETLKGTWSKITSFF